MKARVALVVGQVDVHVELGADAEGLEEVLEHVAPPSLGGGKEGGPARRVALRPDERMRVR